MTKLLLILSMLFIIACDMKADASSYSRYTVVISAEYYDAVSAQLASLNGGNLAALVGLPDAEWDDNSPINYYIFSGNFSVTEITDLHNSLMVAIPTGDFVETYGAGSKNAVLDRSIIEAVEIKSAQVAAIELQKKGGEK